MEKKLFPFFLFLFFISCSDDGKKSLPGITGRPGELVIVIPDAEWKGLAGEKILDHFAADMQGLPQPEPLFDVVQIAPSGFSNIFKTHRNILLAEIKAGNKNTVEVKKDVWAQPQLVIKISAADTASFNGILNANSGKIINYFLQQERERIIDSYTKQKEDDIISLLKEKYNVSLAIPKGYNIAREGDNFVWLQYETSDIIQSILVYQYPYTDQNTFTKNYLVAKRDSIAAIYVPGPEEGSFMQTDTVFGAPVLNEIDFNGQYAAELRGLWYVKNDFMGGPYVNYTFLDKTQNRIISIDAFVFAPKFDKRNYLRQVEAIAYSVKTAL